MLKVHSRVDFYCSDKYYILDPEQADVGMMNNEVHLSSQFQLKFTVSFLSMLFVKIFYKNYDWN